MIRSDRAALAIGIGFFILLVAYTVVPPEYRALPPTWDPWKVLLLTAAILFVATGVLLSDRRARVRFARNKWAVLAVGGFLFLGVTMPALVMVWPSPTYYTEFENWSYPWNLAVWVTLVSQGPMAAGNPIYAASVQVQSSCSPWNISSFTLDMIGLNGSSGRIDAGPTPVDFRICPSGGPFTSSWASTSWTNGSIIFYASGNLPLAALLNVTHTGGSSYFATNNQTNSPTWFLPVSPSDAMVGFDNLRLLGMSIFVGAALTGWFPTVHALEEYWERARGTPPGRRPGRPPESER